MTDANESTTQVVARDDAVTPFTRVVAAAVLPFLVAAFLILYLTPSETGRRFAWEITSPLTAALMGGGYLGGAYFFGRVIFEQRWHRVAAGFAPVAAFTLTLLLTTLIHWAKFDPARWPFQVWLVIYIVTPFLIPLAWWLNRRRDPGRAEPDDLIVPPAVGRSVLALGLLLLAGGAFFLLLPDTAVARWVWPLTPLTARVLGAWHVLLGTGSLVLSAERRWSAWRIPLQAIIFWQLLLALGFVLRRGAFGPSGLLNWYVLFTVGGIAAAVVFYLAMERRRRRIVR